MLHVVPGLSSVYNRCAKGGGRNGGKMDEFGAARDENGATCGTGGILTILTARGSVAVSFDFVFLRDGARRR